MESSWVQIGFVVISCTALAYMRSILLAAVTMALIGWMGLLMPDSSALTVLTVLFVNFCASIVLVFIFFVALQRRDFEVIIHQDLRIFNLSTDRRIISRILSGVGVVTALFWAWESRCGVSQIYLSCIATAVVFGIVYAYDHSINNYFGDSEYRIFRQHHARTHIDLAYYLVCIALVYASFHQNLAQNLSAIPLLLFYVYVAVRYYRAYTKATPSQNKKSL